MSSDSDTRRPRSFRRLLLMLAIGVVLVVPLATAAYTYSYISSPPSGGGSSLATETWHTEDYPPGPEQDATTFRLRRSRVPLRSRTPLSRDPVRRERISAGIQKQLEIRQAMWASAAARLPTPDNSIEPRWKLERQEDDRPMLPSERLRNLFGPPLVWCLGLPDINSRVHAADFDNDGIAELMFIDFDRHRALFYDGTPTSGYALVNTVVIHKFPRQEVQVHDLNADGRVDVLIPGGTARTTLLLNRGEWQFDYRLVQVQWAAGIAQSTDLNGDGTLDMVFGNLREVVQYRNDGNGTLIPGPRLYTGNAERMTLADVDGDGRRDLITLPYWDTNNPPTEVPAHIVKLDKNGLASGKPERLPYQGRLRHLMPFNRTNSPAQDLIGWLPATDEVVLFENSGNGTFRQRPIAELRDHFCMMTADIDGNGWEDLLLGNFVLLNDGGTLSEPECFTSQYWRWPVGFADMDGNGTKDMVFYDLERRSVFIYPAA